MSLYVDKFELDNQDILINGMYTLPKNRKYLIIGDSYATPNNSWVQKLQTALNIPNNNFYTSLSTGAGFTVTDNSKKFIALLQNAQVTEAELITDIILCGGWNDIDSSIDTIYNAISTFMTEAKTLYPNAQVYMGMISWSTRPESYSKLASVRRAYYKSSMLGAKYLNGVEYAMHNGSYFADDVHPNTDGQDNIAQAVIQAYLTGEYRNIDINYNFSLENVNNIFTGWGNDYNCYQSGDETVIHFKSRKFIYIPNGYTSGFVKIGDFVNSHVFGMLENYAPTFDIDLPIRYDDNTTDVATFEFRIVRDNNYTNNSYIDMRVLGLLQPITRFTIYPFKIILNSMLQV